MIFLFDTNVLSEGIKAKPNPNVLAFSRAVPTENMRISAVVLAEIALGVEGNPTPDLQAFLADVRAMPIAEFGESEALEWGRITNQALKAGHSVQARDSMIAATAAAPRLDGGHTEQTGLPKVGRACV
ncbi:MAG: PIN domain-containing protein [Limisphaerales bacterium]